jgi:hydrogenase expression/formation protein HypC
MCLGIPGKIIEIYNAGGLKMGRIDFGGVFREACLEYVPEAKPGDYTIIHAGFAISLLDEDQAKADLEILIEISNFEKDSWSGN